MLHILCGLPMQKLNTSGCTGIYMSRAMFVIRNLKGYGKVRKDSRKYRRTGLVPSRAWEGYVNPVLNDVVEVGTVNYIYQQTE